VKYGWRLGNIAHSEEDVFREAVNFHSQVLLHLNEILGLLTVITHLSLRSPMFGERHFGVLFGMLKLNLLLGDFRQSHVAINPLLILSIPRISEIKLRTQCSQNIAGRKLKCL